MATVHCDARCRCAQGPAENCRCGCHGAGHGTAPRTVQRELAFGGPARPVHRVCVECGRPAAFGSTKCSAHGPQKSVRAMRGF